MLLALAAPAALLARLLATGGRRERAAEQAGPGWRCAAPQRQARLVRAEALTVAATGAAGGLLLAGLLAGWLRGPAALAAPPGAAVAVGSLAVLAAVPLAAATLDSPRRATALATVALLAVAGLLAAAGLVSGAGSAATPSGLPRQVALAVAFWLAAQAGLAVGTRWVVRRAARLVAVLVRPVAGPLATPLALVLARRSGLVAGTVVVGSGAVALAVAGGPLAAGWREVPGAQQLGNLARVTAPLAALLGAGLAVAVACTEAPRRRAQVAVVTGLGTPRRTVRRALLAAWTLPTLLAVGAGLGEADGLRRLLAVPVPHPTRPPDPGDAVSLPPLALAAGHALALNPLDARSLLTAFGVAGIFAVLVAETGLLVGFFLPGDSLLFTAGLFTSTAPGSPLHLPLGQVLVAAAGGALVGAQLGFVLGRRAGARLLAGRRPRLVAAAARAERLLARYGHGRAVVLARFVPVVRTVLNPLAGALGMPARTFTLWQVLGGLGWTVGLVLAGTGLGTVVPSIDRYLLPVVALVVVVSLLPLGAELLRARRERQPVA